ncbi:MAG: PEGA domain-containing protein, partial [Patescibacteria group bacterium]
MSIPVRKIFGFIIIAIFMVVAPAVLLTASGYRYNWKKNSIEKTGVIRIDSAPPGADVIINDRIQRRKTPSLVTALLPDAYRIRLKKNGYLSWEKTLEVASGRTT